MDTADLSPENKAARSVAAVTPAASELADKSISK